ncbi:hypothetical protein [Bacillus sp. REN3]|uniref:hypothetical protein n=1 Tax=Bacillus sp. REN3 TaxID=2802440 RepID=UPI001AED1FB6
MQTRQNQAISLPFPSRWGIDADIGERPIIRGILNIQSVSGNSVTGTVSFRNTHQPIIGTWDENRKQLTFESPYAIFAGQMAIYDDAAIRVRHFVLSGKFTMKPSSEMPGEFGNWIAASDSRLTGPPIYTGAIPPVGVYLLSDLLYRSQ